MRGFNKHWQEGCAATWESNGTYQNQTCSGKHFGYLCINTSKSGSLHPESFYAHSLKGHCNLAQHSTELLQKHNTPPAILNPVNLCLGRFWAPINCLVVHFPRSACWELFPGWHLNALLSAVRGLLALCADYCHRIDRTYSSFPSPLNSGLVQYFLSFFKLLTVGSNKAHFGIFDGWGSLVVGSI